MASGWQNKLFFGDNLEILRQYVETESVDLIYLDPPFNSKTDYNVLFKTTTGEANAAQAIAFKDTWEWDEAAAEAYHELMTRTEVPRNLANLMQALKIFLTGDTGKKGNSMMAYLTMMALRLVELHRVLKPTGSLYLHCDPTSGHYIKLLLDAVFGFSNFRNEIVWSYGGRGAKAIAGQFPRNHDLIFLYSKVKGRQLYQRQFIERRYSQEEARKRGLRQDEDGNWFKTAPRGDYTDESIDRLESEGRIYKTKTGSVRVKYALRREGEHVIEDAMVGDTWTDIPDAMHIGKQYLGYPTQKPEALLERIILASSNESDLVLDPFCGCGTATAVAERLNRRWIGIDITYLAIDLIERRLLDQFTPGNDIKRLADIPVQKRRHALKAYFTNCEDELGIGLETGLKPYEVHGVPHTADDARFLWQKDEYQFEWWAIAMLGAQGKEYKRGADRGIDGIINFQDKAGDYKKAVVSVKGGKLNATMLRDLKGVMQREGAVIGILVTNEPPTKPMKQEAADAGRWNSELHPNRSYPVIQILTAEDILAGRDAEIPRWGLDTFKKAARVRQSSGEQASLLDES